MSRGRISWITPPSDLETGPPEGVGLSPTAPTTSTLEDEGEPPPPCSPAFSPEGMAMRRTQVFSPLWPHVSFLGEFGKKMATSHAIGCDHMTGGFSGNENCIKFFLLPKLLSFLRWKMHL